MEHFKFLNKIDVNDKVDKKKDNTGRELSYLSWAWAWAETKKAYPNAKYEIIKFDNLPYIHDPNTGYMVFTQVTIEDMTHEMWLPVMNGNNKAMKNVQYEYTTKYGKKVVEAATMFDINKSIMRCLTKNLAMFGLGLYIYAGEDLPEEDDQNPKTEPQKTEPQKTELPKTEPPKKKQVKISNDKIKEIEVLAHNVNLDTDKVNEWINKKFNKTNLKDLILDEANLLINALEGLKGKQ